MKKANKIRDKINAPHGAEAIPANQEIEVKLRTNWQGIEAALNSPLLGGPEQFRPETLVSTYFDTPDSRLAGQKIVLRIRQKDASARVQCLKMPAAQRHGMFVRQEFEVGTEKDEPDLALFNPAVRRKATAVIGKAALEKRLETRIVRRKAIIEGNSRIAVALDDGMVVSGDDSRELFEIELELLDGEEADMLVLARELAISLPVQLDIVSKAEKGFQLAAGAGPSPVKAEAVNLSPDCTVDQMIEVVLAEGLKHYCANLAPLRLSDDPEAVHQVRVALRRLRGALGIFARTHPCPEFEDLRQMAGELADGLAEPRAIDVLIEMAGAGPGEDPDCPVGFADLMTRLSARRVQSHEKARALFDTPLATLFALDLRLCLLRRPWRADDRQRRPGKPASNYAARQIERLDKAVLKRGRGIAKLDDVAIHQLRIALKKLRYAAEFWTSLFGHQRRQKAYITAAAALQDQLGTRNDVATAPKLLGDMIHGNETRLRNAADFLVDWHVRNVKQAGKTLARNWSAFKKAKRFWV